MPFDTLIVNGIVVTATDTYAADVAITGGKITSIGTGLPRDAAKQVLDAKSRYVLPGGIDVHTHLDMPFGGTPAPMTLKPARVPPRLAGPLRSLILPSSTRPAFTRRIRRLDAKAASKATSDYAFHCIITDLPNARLEEMAELVREGRAQLQTVHGVSGRVHAGRCDYLQGHAAQLRKSAA